MYVSFTRKIEHLKCRRIYGKSMEREKFNPVLFRTFTGKLE
jgi:hypothetical protein